MGRTSERLPRQLFSSRRRGVAAALVAVAFAGACTAGAADHKPAGTPGSSGGSSAPAKAGGTAVVAMSGDPTGVNPDVSTADSAQRIGCMVYQGLTRADSGNVVRPMLAKSWQVSPDGKTYTFHLVTANWQDGKPFTSADVKYTLSTVSAKYSAIFSTAAKKISSIETPDAHTVVIKTSVPYGPLLISLGCGQGAAILPEHLFKGTDATKNPASVNKPVGTGPFRLTAINRGQDVVMSRNTSYWDAKHVYLDKVVFKEIAEPSAMVLALRAHEVDLVTGTYLPPQNIPTVKSDPSLSIHDVGGSPQDDSMFFNTKGKVTGNVLVRRALLMATDRAYLLRNVFFNVGDVGRSSIDQQIKWAYDPAVDYAKMYPFDDTKAAAMLDQAGYPKKGSSRFTIHITVDASEGPLVSLAQALQAMWRKVGVNVVIDAYETNTVIDRVYTKRDFDVQLESLQSYGDPALGLARQFVTTKTHLPYTNATGYANPKVDALFDEGQSSVSTSVRARSYFALQKILAQDLPTVSLHSYTSVDAAQSRLTGLWGYDQEYWTDTSLSS